MDGDESAGRILPVIMCGGAGTRLWPVSRASMPKQFQAFAGDRTLLQDTVARITGPLFAPPAFVAHEDHRFLLADQVEALGVAMGPVVLEPFGRNTAPVAIVASLLAAERAGPGALVLLLPSDHLVRDGRAFAAAVAAAAPAARAGRICLFGVAPTRPETGYGYIEVGDEPIPGPGDAARDVRRFVEKPAADEAARMVEAGGYAWNSGVFLFAAEALLAEAAERRPDLLAGTREALGRATTDGPFLRLDPEAFARVESISLDYALLEGSRRTAVLPTALDWSDLGAWDAVFDAHRTDADGNVALGRAVGSGTSGSFLWSQGPLVATVGVRDTMVVATGDAVLVADRKAAQGVKGLLDLIKAKGFDEAAAHAEVHRPWGAYRSVMSGERFQVKVITVKPGGRLSLQLHRHRAEHWVVVKGSARITCGERTFMLYENQSTFIPQGETHRLENPGKIPVEIVEVQTGAYLGEDDIVRLEDSYGRS